MKKILFVIAYDNFKDEEYAIPRSILKDKGFSITTVSNKKGIALGVNGLDVEINYLINEIDINDFDVLVFVGGSGCLKALDNQDSYNLINQAKKDDKVITAICIASVILAKAGVLKGKKATVWSSPMDKSPIKILTQNGAIFENLDVVVDGNIITANGPQAAEEFGIVISKHI